MNVKQLKDKAFQLRLDAEAKRKQADKFTYNANDYDKANDTARADMERTEAQKLIDEANATERAAEEHDQGAVLQEARAVELEKEQERLQAEHDRRLQDIEHKKAELRGGTGLFS
ncbi:MAG: hypothetical protein JWP06_480 [Candidatus Saccharibacteria bacterium]|nr:hypothetical protein [Candidatus Saccharibacteria bacterium]